MKKSILSLCLTVAAISAAAQSGFFLQPGAAIGTGEIIRKIYPGITIHYDNALETNYQLGIGYRSGNWRFNTGVSYLRTGYQDNALFATNSSFQYETYYEFFHHLMVPLTVGYQVRLSDKFVLVPALGLEASYNIDEKEHISGQSEYTVPDKTFTKNYNSVSAWAIATLHAEYKLTEHLSIFAGPSGQWMLTNFYKVPSGAPYTATQHNYAYLVDAGVVWHVHSKKATVQPNSDASTE